MRCYDKLIATIYSSQGTEGLRSSFGLAWATVVSTASCVAMLQAKT